MRRLHGRRRAAALVIQKSGLPLVEEPTADWPQHARRIIDQELRVLRTAPLYVMAPSMCDVTAAAAQTLTLPDLAFIDEADLTTAEGLLMLPHPLPTSDGTGVCQLRALGWSVGYAWYRNDTAPDGVDLTPRLRISVYDDPRHLSHQNKARLTDVFRAEGHELPPILLRYVNTLPFHGTIPSQADHERLTEALHAAAAEIADELRGVSGTGEQAEYVPGTVLPDPDRNVAQRFCYAFFRLVEQRIAAAEPAPVNHSARLIAQRAGTTPESSNPTIRDDSTPVARSEPTSARSASGPVTHSDDDEDRTARHRW